MVYNNQKLIKSKLALRKTEYCWEVYTTLNGSAAHPDFKWLKITDNTAIWYQKTFPGIPVNHQLESTR